MIRNIFEIRGRLRRPGIYFFFAGNGIGDPPHRSLMEQSINPSPEKCANMREYMSARAKRNMKKRPFKVV